MRNWSIDTRKLKKFPQEYEIWRLEQLINFGLGREKLRKTVLKKYLPSLVIDKNKKKYLQFIVSGK